MGTKNQRAVYYRSTFWMIKYMNGSVFSKARYMNGVGFEILARTPVPKLTLSHTPHPPPRPLEAVCHSSSNFTLIQRLQNGFVEQKYKVKRNVDIYGKPREVNTVSQFFIQTSHI